MAEDNAFPSIADQTDSIGLPDGSTVDADLFENMESNIAADDPEDFQTNQIEQRKADDPLSPFTANTAGTANIVAGARHEQRSERAQSVDEEYNAPIAPDYETWAEHPNRYDLPGVDTIPQDEQTRRGEAFLNQAQEMGVVDEVERGTLQGTKKGEFTATPDTTSTAEGAPTYETMVEAEPEIDDADFPAFKEGSVLAHETGHAVDFEAGGRGESFLSKRGFFARHDGNLFSEAYDLSERVRGKIDKQRAHYREDERELIADSMAAMAIEPRAAKREAPNLTAALEEDIDLRVGDEDESPFDF